MPFVATDSRYRLEFCSSENPACWEWHVTGNAHHAPWVGRGVSVTIVPSAPLCRPVPLQRLSFCTSVQSGHLPVGSDADRAGRATAAAADPSRSAATDRAAIQRTSGPGAQARQAGGRAEIIPFGCAAGQQPPTATLAQDGSGKVFPCSVTQRREFTRLGSAWPVVIGPAEWLLLASLLSRDSAEYAEMVWITCRSRLRPSGHQIGPSLRSPDGEVDRQGRWVRGLAEPGPTMLRRAPPHSPLSGAA